MPATASTGDLEKNPSPPCLPTGLASEGMKGGTHDGQLTRRWSAASWAAALFESGRGLRSSGRSGAHASNEQ